MNSFINDKWELVSLTDIGTKRKENQDVLDFAINNNILFSILCDGMGGCSYGLKAATEVVNFMIDIFKKTDFSKVSNLINWLKTAIFKLKKYLINFVSENTIYKNFGTTLICMIFKDYNCYIANIGDSRAYLFENKFLQVTTDQNLKNSKKYKHLVNEVNGRLLTSALGPNKRTTIDFYVIKKYKGDILFTSDGVHNFVSKKEFENILKMNLSLKLKVNKLFKLSLKNNSSDNISIILIRIN